MKRNVNQRLKHRICATNNESGFTLTEMLVVVAIIAILTPALIFTFNRLMRSYTTENAVGGIQQTTRFAVEYLIRDIRMTGFDPTGSADAGIEQAINIPDPGDGSVRQWIRFTSDIDKDGEIEDGGFERITYRYDPNAQELVQVLDEGSIVTPPTGTLVENVTNLSFTFFDSDDNVVIPANPTDMVEIGEIRSVQIDLTVEEPAGIVGQRERSYSSRVRIRNFDI